MTAPARFRLVVSAALAAVGVTLAADPKPAPTLPAASAEKIEFDKHVRPILAGHCWKCHAADKQKGGLRLDSRAGVLTGGDLGPAAVVGKSAESRLVRFCGGLDPEFQMPPGKKLPAATISTLRAWIDQGLTFPEGAGPVVGKAKPTHWAFQPIARPAVPKPVGEVRNPIDAFVLARLEKEKVKPSSVADPETLCRRLFFDLTGLPPSPKEVDEFLNDKSPDAYEKLVDRLLASPHYGERWGRYWLDVARYADSDGYEKDTGRPFAWRYREWVIQALNRDLPFDRFTVEQMAGDLLPNATTDQKIATGFHRNTLTNKEGGVDQEEFRVAACVDRVSTVGKAWLGLTVGCSQCHDHKYDPVSQREFYQLFAFFNSDRETDIPVPLAGESPLAKLSKELQAEWKTLNAAVEEARAKNLSSADMVKRDKALADFEKKHGVSAKAMTLSAGPKKATHVMIRGDFLRKGVEVQPGTPAVLPPMPGNPSAPTRLDLANWIVSPDNPLTARVIANWVWSKYLGRGIVVTLEDFGTQGEKPSHPELLDWLAAEFRDPNGCGWSLKKLHKTIVTSATYRRSSHARPDLIDKDPLNVLLARQARLRLEAEIVRDRALAASGLLTRTVGGPSVRPPQPTGISELTYANAAKWVESTGADRYKRGMYIWFQRTSPYPMLMTFDSPDSNVCAVRRERSNTPLQALTLLNDAVFVEAAQALAKRVLAEAKGKPTGEAIGLAFKLCFGRAPSAREESRLGELLAAFRADAAANPAEAAKLIGPHKLPGVQPAEAAAWVALGRTLMNLDEFVTRD